MALAAGEKLGPYELVSPLGPDGMGEIWTARDSRLQRTVAVEVSKAAFTDRFEREARGIAALNHPHICTLFDVGPNYLVMELVDGTPLKRPMPLEKAVAPDGRFRVRRLLQEGPAPIEVLLNLESAPGAPTVIGSIIDVLA